MLTAYVETTIPSYLTAWPSRDLLRAAHQQVTRDWWRTAASRFDLFVSEAVLEEIVKGDAQAAKDRQLAVKDLRVLEVNSQVIALARDFSIKLPLPSAAAVDIVHLACATIYQMDYLVTWNCAHIANAQIIRQLTRLNDDAGRSTPLIVTPEALLEDSE